MLKSVLILGGLIGASAFAQGSGSTGGGDTGCESRILELRADLDRWVKQGGPKGLNFHGTSTDLEKYSQAMSKVLVKNVVAVSCISPSIGVPEPILVYGQPKTCKWSVSAANQKLIQCNSDRFLRLTTEEQYRLIHHEYAGIAGVEPNNREHSDYTLSNQIGAFLRNQVVQRLSIRPYSGRLTLINSDKTDSSRAAMDLILMLLGNPIVKDPFVESYHLSWRWSEQKIHQARRVLRNFLKEAGLEKVILRAIAESSDFGKWHRTVQGVDPLTNGVVFQIEYELTRNTPFYSHMYLMSRFRLYNGSHLILDLE